MEKELNIAAILRDKPGGTKLWSPIYGDCELGFILTSNKTIPIQVTSTSGTFYFRKDGRYDKNGEVCLFPSKEMRDWSKFAWKKGDVLISKDTDSLCVFDSFEDDTYSTFNVKYYNNPLYLSFDLGVISRATEPFTKVDDDEAKNFIRKIEEHYGGKLNLQTLEIEKPELQFKDGDIVFIKGETKNSNSIGIFKDAGNGLNSHLWVNYFYKRDELRVAESSDDYVMGPAFDDKVRFATLEEIRKLFVALDKEGKAWDVKEKQIIDLPKKCELKPFDKVLVRDDLDNHWRPYFFYKVDSDKDYPYTMVNGEVFSECIPYNDKTAHLLGTTDDWKGGEE